MNLSEAKKMIEKAREFYKKHEKELRPALKESARFLENLAGGKDSAARAQLLEAIQIAEGREKELLEIAELEGAIEDVREVREGPTTVEMLADGVSALGLIVQILAQAKGAIL